MTLRPDGYFSLIKINLIPLGEHGWAFSCLISYDCHLQRQALRFVLIDVIGNILVFMPIGLGLAGLLYEGYLRRTIYKAMLGGFMLSLSIELIQLTIPSRTTDIDDLIFNTLGAIIGAMFFGLLLWLHHRYATKYKKVTSPG